MHRPTVFIAMPAFGQVNYARTTASLMALAKTLIGRGSDYYFCDQSFPDIAEVRNMLSTIWYDRTDAEHLLFIDSDMGFEPALVLDMLDSGHKVVGCMAPVRSYPIRWIGEWDGEPEVLNGFMRVKDVGAGVMLIHRSAVTAMLDIGVAKSDNRLERRAVGDFLRALGLSRIIRAFDTIETESGKLSEDKSFCRRHRECGGDIWAAVNHTIAHVGPHAFSGRFADVLERTMRMKIDSELLASHPVFLGKSNAAA